MVSIIKVCRKGQKDIMNITMSLILYNPLEAAVLLFCCFLMRDVKYKEEKFNLKKFIINCYILGTILLMFQSPMNILTNAFLNTSYSQFVNFIVMPIIVFNYYKKCNFVKVCAVIVFYMTSLNFAVFILGLPVNPSLIIEDRLIKELIANIFIRALQLIIIFGGILVKNFLKSMAKKNIGNSIASTANGYGEPKLTAKLEDEIKK